mgnify:CR=1 FL=1
MDFKVLPHSIEAEQALLGSLLVDNGGERTNKVLSMVKSETFYNRQHGVIFDAVKGLHSKNLPVDFLTVTERLNGMGVEFGGLSYLAEITKGTPSAANMIGYATVIRDHAISRYAIGKLNDSIDLMMNGGTLSSAEKIDAISVLTGNLSEYAKTGKRGGLRKFEDVMEDWINEVDKRFDPNTPRGIVTGIQALDDMMAPKFIPRGSLFVIGARPKIGKTTLFTKMAVHCGLVQNLPVTMFSLEMPSIQIFEKTVSQSAGVNSNIFYEDDSDEMQFSLANAKAGELVQSGNFYVDDTPGPTIEHIRNECRKIYRERGVMGMIMIDYLTLMKADKAERNDLAYGNITKALKELAKELNCVVVLLTQLNRKLEDRADKRPMPSDSRDTGQIEQECDFWLGLYREGAYREVGNPGLTEYIMRLNRHGGVGTAYVNQRNGNVVEIDQDEARAEAESWNNHGNSKGKGEWRD